jgi:putative ABC transport system permease protein
LNEPNTIVISKTLAKKYFGNEPALGKTLRSVYDVYKVSGVVADVPKNSHLIFDMLISSSTILRGNHNGDDWGSFNNFTYVLLKPGTNAAAFNRKLIPLYDKFMAPIFAKYNVKIHYGVQPITAIHLHSEFEGEPEELGNMSYIWIFSAVAFFMLLIACINYMNHRARVPIP